MTETASEKDPLEAPVRYLKGVGEARAAHLERMGIRSVGEILLSLPRRYEDRRNLCPLNRLLAGEMCTASGRVVSAQWVRPRSGRGCFEALLSDERGLAVCRWYGAAYLADQIQQGDTVVVHGKVVRRRGETLFEHPDFEVEREDAGDSIHMGRIVPVYPLTAGIPQRVMRRILWNAVTGHAEQAVDALPAEVRARREFPSLAAAFAEAHFPTSMSRADRARARLVFDEFLSMQLVLAARKAQAERFVAGRAMHSDGALRSRFLESLPFRLTRGQEQALAEILSDMAQPHPMHRLLQGDVGSGKTVVAAAAIVEAVASGAQAAVMAPTEILATQHEQTFRRLLGPLGLRVGLITGSLKPGEKIAQRAGIAAGRFDVAVGTHALITDRVVFDDLGLVVIDEQHKFGVEQRGLLYGKGARPDVLVMTATPIPRTLAMTLYGDLDVTTILERPAGRQPIVTRVIGEATLPKAYEFIRAQVAKGRQSYIVYPLVEESETLDVRAATKMVEQLRSGPFAGLRVDLLHGQMKGEEKDRVMAAFREGRTQILVATSVIEVGVDVPNATVMLVENAERFGLSQLHQLRGRIGRGAHRSYCVLQGHPRSRDAWKRLKVMEETEDGFRIAEEDFRIRGMGNLLGREQSGSPLLRVADPLRDIALLEAAREEAFRIIGADPRLEKPEHALLRERARAMYRAAAPFVKVG